MSEGFNTIGGCICFKNTSQCPIHEPDPVPSSRESVPPLPWKLAPSWDQFTVVGANGEEIIYQDGAYDTPTIKRINAELIVKSVNAHALLIEAVEAAQVFIYKKNDYYDKDTEAIRLLLEAALKAVGRKV